MKFSITLPDGIDKIIVESYDPYFIEPSYEDIFCKDDAYNLKIQLNEFEKIKPRVEKVIKKAKKTQLHENGKIIRSNLETIQILCEYNSEKL